MPRNLTIFLVQILGFSCLFFVNVGPLFAQPHQERKLQPTVSNSMETASIASVHDTVQDGRDETEAGKETNSGRGGSELNSAWLVFIPLVIGMIALVNWLSGRNANLSDRLRAASETLKDPETECKELVENLLFQTKHFLIRYTENNRALSFALIAMGTFSSLICIPIILLIYSGLHPWYFPTAIALFFLFGGWLASRATRLALSEIRPSSRTLYAEVEFACRSVVAERATDASKKHINEIASKM